MSMLLDANPEILVPDEVFTSLDNYLMPLIRYKIGDLAVKSKNR